MSQNNNIEGNELSESSTVTTKMNVKPDKKKSAPKGWDKVETSTEVDVEVKTLQIDLKDFPEAYKLLNRVREEIKEERKNLFNEADDSFLGPRKNKLPNPNSAIIAHSLMLLDEKEIAKIKDASMPSMVKHFRNYQNFIKDSGSDLDFMSYLAKGFDPKKLN